MEARTVQQRRPELWRGLSSAGAHARCLAASTILRIKVEAQLKSIVLAECFARKRHFQHLGRRSCGTFERAPTKRLAIQTDFESRTGLVHLRSLRVFRAHHLLDEHTISYRTT